MIFTQVNNYDIEIMISCFNSIIKVIMIFTQVNNYDIEIMISL
ncbi:hypothetical protein ES705_12937 [subsurface metagenome]